MGQYYNAIVENKDNKRGFEQYNIFRSIGEDYGGQKLMEHSWLRNGFVNSVAKLLYHSPRRVMWMGDYTEDSDFSRIIKNHIGVAVPSVEYGENLDKLEDAHDFSLDGKYLVNHDKKQYIDMDKYIEMNDADGWVVHPLPLLTCTSNQRGGGDYYGSDSDSVGTWEWDTISIEDDKQTLDGFKEVDFRFSEE